MTADPVGDPPEIWLVRPTAIVAGRLHLEAGMLVIRDGDRVALRLPLSQITGVRKLRATPVIELQRRTPELDEILLLYFARPPGGGAWHEETMGAPKGGLERAAGMLRLRAEHRARKEAVRAWERALREAAG